MKKKKKPFAISPGFGSSRPAAVHPETDAAYDVEEPGHVHRVSGHHHHALHVGVGLDRRKIARKFIL